MKTLLTLTLFAGLTTFVGAETSAKAIIVFEDDAEVVWLTEASDTGILYKETEVAIDRKKELRSKLVSILMYEPASFKEAQKLFENRAYAEAKEKFAACAEEFKALEELPGNYSTLAEFYQMECCRLMEDLEGLAQLREKFRSETSLERESHKLQLEVYQAWDAVRTKSWKRLADLSTAMLERDVWSGTQLAQIYYCQGLGFQGQDMEGPALNAFNGAMTADFTASAGIVRNSVLNCLRIISANEDVKTAMSHFGTEDEDPNSEGYAMLQEGVALCEMWKKALGGGQPLPEEFAGLLKFKVASKVGGIK